jgi:hypothetical protein
VWPGTAIISMEFFAPRAAEKIRLVVEEYGDSGLHVVLTARDLARNLAASWVEHTQNGGTITWDDFLAMVREPDLSQPNPGRAFWRQQDIPGIAERWSSAVGRDRFTLVTVPSRPAGNVLWGRFCEVAGIDPDRYDATAVGNPSIGAASAELLRRLNIRLQQEDLTDREYHRIVKHALAKRGLGARPDRGETMAVKERWVLRRSRADVERLRALGLRVVGDLDELVARPVEGLRRVETADQLSAAVDALAVMVRMQAEQARARAAERVSDVAEEESP